MLTVYKLYLDDQYQHLLIEDLEFIDKFRFEGKTLRKVWSPPAVYSPAPKLRVPDFWDLVPINSFALSQRLFSTLPLLQRTGELLPLKFEDSDVHVFNVTNVVDCLDKKKSVYNIDLARVKEYAFKPKRFSQSICRVPEAPDLLAVEGLVPPEQELRAIVEKRKLKGLIFDKVWSEVD